MKPYVLTGVLREVEVNRVDGVDENYLVFAGDKEKFSPYILNDADAPFNQRIQATFVDSRLISWDWPNEAVVASRGDKTKDIAFVRVVEPGYLTESIVEETKLYAEELEHFLRETNDGLWEHIEVTPYNIENHEQQVLGLHTFQYSLVEDRLRAQHPDKWDHHNYWHGRGGANSSLLGLAELNGVRAWTWLGGRERTVEHECGHNLGCPHSNGKYGEYQHPSCKMGKSFAGFCAPQLALLGQLREENIEHTDGDSCHFLCPVETSHRDVRVGESQAVVFKEKNGFRRYILSTRKTREQSIVGSTYDNDVGAVYIEETGVGFFKKPVYQTRLLEQGDEIVIGGHTIINAGKSGGVVRVKVGFAATEPFPKALEPVPGDMPDPKHSAIWYDPKFKHQGFDLTIHRGRLTGYFFGYHPKGPHSAYPIPGKVTGRRWLVLEGKVEDGYVKFDIQSVQNGEPRKEGSGTIVFEGNTARLRWDTRMYGRESYQLSKLSPTKKNHQLYSIGDYSGISVAEYHGDTIVYYYGPGLGGQDWYAMSGDPEDLPIYKTEQKHRATRKTEVETVGRAKLGQKTFEMFGREHTIVPILPK